MLMDGTKKELKTLYGVYPNWEVVCKGGEVCSQCGVKAKEGEGRTWICHPDIDMVVCSDCWGGVSPWKREDCEADVCKDCGHRSV